MNICLSTLLITSLLCSTFVNASDIVTFAPGCQSHIVQRSKAVSRDETYLTFYRHPQPCYLQGVIGGEHQTFINVIAFAGEKYLVSLVDEKSNTRFSIAGDGINLSTTALKNEQIIEIESQETYFTISPSAYPYGEYMMTIEKI